MLDAVCLAARAGAKQAVVSDANTVSNPHKPKWIFDGVMVLYFTVYCSTVEFLRSLYST